MPTPTVQFDWTQLIGTIATVGGSTVAFGRWLVLKLLERIDESHAQHKEHFNRLLDDSKAMREEFSNEVKSCHAERQKLQDLTLQIIKKCGAMTHDSNS